MSPRSPERNEQLRAESRAIIVRHALRLFAKHGYDGTTIRMIAEGAVVSQGLIYQHFASKEILLREIFVQSMRDVQASFAVAESAAAPDERIGQLIRGSFHILRANLDFWRLSYAVRMQTSVRAQLGNLIPAWTTSIVRTLEGYLREAGIPRPRVEAAILFALIDGVSQHFVLSPRDYPLDEVADRVIELYRQRAESAQRAKAVPSRRQQSRSPSAPTTRKKNLGPAKTNR